MLQYKYKGSVYDPNSDLAMYDLLYKLTDAEEYIGELEARNRRLQREVARLDRLIPQQCKVR